MVGIELILLGLWAVNCPHDRSVYWLLPETLIFAAGTQVVLAALVRSVPEVQADVMLAMNRWAGVLVLLYLMMQLWWAQDRPLTLIGTLCTVAVAALGLLLLSTEHFASRVPRCRWVRNVVM